jgi:hypothetical protein
VIEIHKGSIRAENRQPGPGLRVSFELPVVAKQKHDMDELAPTASIRWKKTESSTHSESEEIV